MSQGSSAACWWGREWGAGGEEPGQPGRVRGGAGGGCGGGAAAEGGEAASPDPRELSLSPASRTLQVHCFSWGGIPG